MRFYRVVLHKIFVMDTAQERRHELKLPCITYLIPHIQRISTQCGSSRSRVTKAYEGQGLHEADFRDDLRRPPPTADEKKRQLRSATNSAPCPFRKWRDSLLLTPRGPDRVLWNNATVIDAPGSATCHVLDRREAVLERLKLVAGPFPVVRGGH